MDDSRVARRAYLAGRILATYSGQATGREVFAELKSEDYDDPALDELLDLFVHQPAKSRLWGLTGTAYDQYVAEVCALATTVMADARVSRPDGEG